MRIESPLSKFTDVLQQVQESADTYKDTLSKNESATRAVLIDPVLRALGWDTGNPYMVEVEKGIGRSRVDYALLDYEQNTQVIIEAKKLGADLSDPDIYMNLVKYAFSAEVTDIFLTDGIHWRHYTNFHPKAQEPTKTMSIGDETLVDMAGYLVQRIDAAKYWPNEEDISDLNLRLNQLESELARLTQQLSDTQKDAKPSGINKKPDRSFPNSAFIPLTNIDEITGLRPSLLRIPNGNEIEITSWRDVLHHCAIYALEQNTNLPIPLPDAAGKKVSLLAKSKPAKRLSHFETMYNGEKIFVYTNYDAKNCIRNALHILAQLPDGDETPAVIYG